MASPYDDIRATLESHLSAMVGVPSVAYENVSFEPPRGSDWCKTQLLPTMRKPACRGSNPQQRYQGVFTIFCYTPEGVGPSRADDLADLVIEHFDATTDIVHPSNPNFIVSTEYAEREGGKTNQPYYYVPVNVGWYLYNN